MTGLSAARTRHARRGGDRPDRVEFVRDTRGRREREILQPAVVRRIEDGIEDQVHRIAVLTNDWTQLRRNAVGIPLLGVETQFHSQSVEKPLIIAMGLATRARNLNPSDLLFLHCVACV